MIKNLINDALKSEGSGILENLGLDSNKQGKAIDLAKESMMSGLTNSLSSGKIGDITKAFSGGTSSPLVQSIVAEYGSSLIQKLGLNATLAKTISSTLIPAVFNFINNRDDAPTDNDSGVKDLMGDLVKNTITNKLGGILKNKFKF